MKLLGFFSQKKKKRLFTWRNFFQLKNGEPFDYLKFANGKLLQDHHFAIWGKISTFPAGLNVAFSVSPSLRSSLENFPLNVLGHSFGAQQKHKVLSRNRVSESSCGPCNSDPFMTAANLNYRLRLLHHHLMKYTLGRTDLSRAHHMLLMHQNFSSHRQV